MKTISNNCFIFALFLIIINQNCFNCTVYKIPDYEDKNYWENVAINHLNKILSIEDQKPIAKNIILFIGDGMGLTTISASRIRKGQLNNKAGEEGYLEFEKFPNIGLSKTYNIDKQVPDSAGTATAMFSGVKTRYGVLGLDITSNTTHNKIGQLTTIMDWAINAKKKTGIVTTTRITHATPAALYSHTPERDWECDSSIPKNITTDTKDIARQLVEDFPGNNINVILGGGRFMLGAEEKNDDKYINDTIFNGGIFEKYCKRDDGKNLVNYWLNQNNSNKKYYVKNTEELLNLNPNDTEYVLGLFTPNHMPFNLVRNKELNGEPSLSDMTKKTIELLSNNNSNGYVLMIEGGRIDQAHHQNRPLIALDEVLEFEKAILLAKELTNNDDTLIIVTADHSHSMTFNGYPVRGNDILGFANKVNITPYETLSYANGPGYWDHRQNTTNNVNETWIKVKDIQNRSSLTYRHLATLPLKDETHGGEDVTVYATGPGSQLIRGVFEQNYIGYVISYVGCFGPAEKLNKLCKEKSKLFVAHNNGHTNRNYNNYNLYILLFIIIIFKPFFMEITI